MSLPFLAIGVAADLVALVMPSCAARLWQGRQRATSLAAWAVWLMTFAFAVTAGVGFASVNITDVTTARAARVTPAVQAAQGALTDAMAARDRECKGGVGKFCREREAAVLVLGSTHRGRVGSVVPGGVASHLLCRAPCAIAVAPVGFAESPQSSGGAIGAFRGITWMVGTALPAAEGSAGCVGLAVRLARGPFYAIHAFL